MVKVGIIGASGLIGRATIDKALSKGHQVLALAPSAKEFDPREGLTVVEGSFSHGPDILKLVKGGSATADRNAECDVVMLCLADLVSAGTWGRGEAMTPAVVSLLVAKPKRVIVVTSNGCNAPLGPALQRALLPCFLGKPFSGAFCTFKDMQQADTLVQQSTRQSWLLIRPNNVTDEGKTLSTWTYEATARPGLRMSGISTRDVAQFIVDHLENNTWDNCPVHLFKGNKNVFDGIKQ